MKRRRFVLRLLSGLLSLALVAAFVVLGVSTGWKLPREQSVEEQDDWCETHSVPETACIECGKLQRPRKQEYGWCDIHGVHECVLCHPELVQTAKPQDWRVLNAQAARALASTPRTANNTRCKLHGRTLQLADAAMERVLGLGVAEVITMPIRETLTLTADITAAPQRQARLGSRIDGTVWRVFYKPGDTVKAGDVVALLESTDAGKAKSELIDAILSEDAKRLTVANLRTAGAGLAPKLLQDAEAEAETARMRTLAADQTLANLGLSATAADLRGLDGPSMAAKLKLAGLSYELAFTLQGTATPGNLVPILAPQSGTLSAFTITPGERLTAGRAFGSILDSTRVAVQLTVRLEDATRVRTGQTVVMNDSRTLEGTIDWVSPVVDETTRTVRARMLLPNTDGKLRIGTATTARVVLRSEPTAVVVPMSAVHWEGDCHVVFVRDKDYETSDIKTWHVRKVRPAGEHMGLAGSMTEIAAGLVPGEWVATANSGIFRSELLKNDLGEG